MVCSKGMSLSFIAPALRDGKPVIHLQKEAVEQEFSKWQNTLILYLPGGSPTVESMHTFVEQKWYMVAKPTLVFHEKDGYFSATFNSLNDRNTILFSGPYYVGGEPMIMKPWTPDLNFEKEVFLRVIPLWVRFPNLPLNCWGADSLSRIGSVIGKPLFADESTSKKSRISYARVLIDTDVTKPLPDTVTIADPSTGKTFLQQVLFEWNKEEGNPAKERYMEYMERGPISQLNYCINTYREAAMSNDHKFDHICHQEKQKVLNACTEAETWLILKRQQQDAHPKSAAVFFNTVAVTEKTNEVDRFCKTIMTKPKPATNEKEATLGEPRQPLMPIDYRNWKDLMLKYQTAIRMAISPPRPPLMPTDYGNWKYLMLKYQMGIRMAIRNEVMETLFA